MNKQLHKMRVGWVLMVLAWVMLSVMPVSAAENLTASVSAEEVSVQEDGSFTFSVTLSADFPFLASDIGVRCSEGVLLTAVTSDNRQATVLPLTPGQTEGREGRIYFGFFASNTVNEITFTLSGVCQGEGTIAFEDIGVTNTSYEIVTTRFATVIKLSGGSTAPVVTDPAVSEPVTDAPVTDTPVTDAPVTDAPATDTPVTEPGQSGGETVNPVTTLEQAGVETDKPVTEAGQSTAVTTSAASGPEQPEVPTTGDMNVPMLQICCAVIAVIAASALIYFITHKPKVKKGE